MSLHELAARTFRLGNRSFVGEEHIDGKGFDMVAHLVHADAKLCPHDNRPMQNLNHREVLESK